jgi:hypothetical protein
VGVVGGGRGSRKWRRAARKRDAALPFVGTAETAPCVRRRNTWAVGRNATHWVIVGPCAHAGLGSTEQISAQSVFFCENAKYIVFRCIVDKKRLYTSSREGEHLPYNSDPNKLG